MKDDTRYIQETSVERLGENEEYFDGLIESLFVENPVKALRELEKLPMSDRDREFTYSDISKAATEQGERILYDNSEHIITTDLYVIVLYKKI